MHEANTIQITVDQYDFVFINIIKLLAPGYPETI